MNLEGERFGGWAVLYEGERDHPHHRMWWCRCDCGTVRKVRQQHLRSGRSVSCGCAAQRTTTQELIDRFSEKLIPVPECGCWLIENGNDHSMKYGYLWMYGRNVAGHRAAWLLYRGEIPEGLWVLHKCDTPGCCNPDHLFLGTADDNIQDCIKKDRRRYALGEYCGTSKLTSEQVREIRRLKSLGVSAREIGDRFGVTSSNVYHVCKGDTWRHLDSGQVVRRETET